MVACADTWWPNGRHYTVRYGERAGFVLGVEVLGVGEETRTPNPGATHENGRCGLFSDPAVFLRVLSRDRRAVWGRERTLRAQGFKNLSSGFLTTLNEEPLAEADQAGGQVTDTRRATRAQRGWCAIAKVHGSLLVLNLEERPPWSVAPPPSLECQPVWPDDVHVHFFRMQVTNQRLAVRRNPAATRAAPKNGCFRGESCHKVCWEMVPVRVADAPKDALIRRYMTESNSSSARGDGCRRTPSEGLTRQQGVFP